MFAAGFAVAAIGCNATVGTMEEGMDGANGSGSGGATARLGGATAAAVTASLTSVANGNSTTVLGFNEPNKTDQSNLTVATAISLWPQLIANPAILVGSPATSADAPGQAWFTDFMNQATTQGLRV